MADHADRQITAAEKRAFYLLLTAQQIAIKQRILTTNLDADVPEIFFSAADFKENNTTVLTLLAYLTYVNPAVRFFIPHGLDRELEYRVFATVSASRDSAGHIAELLELLEKPIRLFPQDIFSQLQHILQHWSFLPSELRLLITGAASTLRDEQRYLAARTTIAGSEDYNFPVGGHGSQLTARYSQDHEWMNSLVLLAKNALVWMHQLSRFYNRNIYSLADIPDEELKNLATRGITGIWLIGIWQRSGASLRIKRSMGAEHALASAYSLYDYEVSESIGGRSGLFALKEKALHYGIRLGSDMVPNHTGIDSRLIAEHPDWFIQVDQPPYAAYSFTHENLSADPSYEIRIEDHYYDKSDAAVVFEHIDRMSGRRRYIYHGNDGTTTPWNDTAQLDFTKPEVQQAVMGQILRVAELTPIIRFDAAMTLTRKHYKRLWFAAGGDEIASRNRAALSEQEFNRVMPHEFWRDVVQTIASHKPDTLLLAEAFWFTEPFFVKELGMHRVYNSAFMHMLRDEDNAKFRRGLARALTDEPQILKRYTNFMNNPDEDSAATQFGTSDKYFGITTLLATLPGLPMVGHGQFEGFREKYGMEFERPMLDETPNESFIERHVREIFPLLNRRADFAPVEYLHLLSLHENFTPNENVFAYVTGGNAPVLVLYNNQYAAVKGLVEPSPLRALGLGESGFARCRELRTGAEHTLDLTGITAGGFQAQLGGYETRVLCDFRLIAEPAKRALPMHQRIAGLSLPVFAMRSTSSCGIGEFKDIAKVIPFLQASGLKLLYILPVNDTGENPSPYSAVSAFALNPVFMHLDDLPGVDVFMPEISTFRTQQATNVRIKYREVYLFKEAILRKIFAGQTADTSDWIKDNSWIQGYAKFKGEPVEYCATVQMYLSRQLIASKGALEAAGILLKGDLPIMLERNSADVRDNPDLFDMNYVAGAPPDMFSTTGQNWGFPIYNWTNHIATGLKWWKNRVRVASRYFHAYRIDHVLGFFRIWAIAQGENSGLNGVFNPTRGASHAELKAIGLSDDDIHYLSQGDVRTLIAREQNFYFSWTWRDTEQFHKMPAEKQASLATLRASIEDKSERERKELGRQLLTELKAATDMIVCAEDLGVVPDYVPRTLEDLGIYGLKVDRWSRHYDRAGEPVFSPEEFPRLSIAMSSVHDSSSLRGYLTDERNESARHVHDALGKVEEASPQLVERLIKRLFESNAGICLIPFQDFYAMLDTVWSTPASTELINIPGQVLDANWSYVLPLAVEKLKLETDLTAKIKALVTGASR